MPTTRRQVIKALAGATAAVAVPKRLRGSRVKRAAPDAVGMLYDPVRCIGCRRCILGCAEARGCEVEEATTPNPQLTVDALTVLQRYRPQGIKTYCKVQCMHCVDPACVSACMLGAMSKQADGSVTWNGDLCVGCRYCQIACPFNVPRFEWDTPTPELKKCDLCAARRAEGQLPACVERCRRDALLYGGREELLAEARSRIAAAPQLYNPHIYGEHDGGGTSVLYLAKAGVSFAEMGLPELGHESVPTLPETLQHTIYKGMIAPLALLGTFGLVVRRNTRLATLAEAAEAEHERHDAEPVGGSVFTWPFAVLALLFVAGVLAIAWRFTAGLGAVTNLSDGYPMGIWIAFDVVTGTALACGGYAMALLVYLLNRGKYHPLVRAAIVTSVLGYSLGGLSVLIDIGRAWNFYKIPLYVSHWNTNSILLEVALCIMLYTMVLWLELSPALFEQWRKSEITGLRRFAVAVSPGLERAMPYLIAFGMVLPTMHQSSLGSLMLMAGAKLHPLWSTPWLPLLFLISAIAIGYAAVTLEALVSARVFKRPSELPMLRALGLPAATVLLLYVALRWYDVVSRGLLPEIVSLNGFALLFLLEMSLFSGAAVGLLVWRRHASAGFMSVIATLMILGGALYRFSTYLIAFKPGPQWSYFPALPEIAVTVGLVAAEVMGYLIIVKRFPILRGVSPSRATHASGRGRGPARSDATQAGGSRGREAVPAATVVALLALLTFAAPLRAQTGAAVTPPAVAARAGQQPVPRTRAQQPAPREDLRCLTDDARTCLPKALSRSEPHNGRCATCHDLSEQVRFADAAKTCASANCHARVDTLTPFHRGLRASVRNNCIGCHNAHDARIHSGEKSCVQCHSEGGQFSSRQSMTTRQDVKRLMVGDPAFRHEQHRTVTCTSCHGSGLQHAEFTRTRLQECRSCHHREPLVTNCRNCHDPEQIRTISKPVTWTFGIKLGSLVQPRREVPFAHSSHIEESCQSCHASGARPSAAAASCSSCHEDHHRPTANCTQCHEPPAAGAHTRTAHLGCAGAGCHEAAPAPVRDAPRTRSLCLSCHETKVDHRAEASCVSCHKLPPPRTGGVPAPAGRDTTKGQPEATTSPATSSSAAASPYSPLATAHSRPSTSRRMQLVRK